MERNNMQFWELGIYIHKATWSWAPGGTPAEEKTRQMVTEYWRLKWCIYSILPCGQYSLDIENLRGTEGQSPFKDLVIYVDLVTLSPWTVFAAKFPF